MSIPPPPGSEEPEPILVPPGMRGVAVTDTEVSDVQGGAGFYHYRQYSATDLAASRSFEDVWALLIDGRLPVDRAAQHRFAAEVRSRRALPTEILDLLPALAGVGGAGSLDGLRSAVSVSGCVLGMRALWDLDTHQRREDLLRIAAVVPTLAAAMYRLRLGLEPVPPDADLDHAANYLWMLSGRRPEMDMARAMERYLILTMDHGFNNSTFAARVIASSGADAAAAVTGAIGSLSGPLHGSAPGRALETLEAIGTATAATAWIRGAIDRGERIMGFGHAVYTGSDPRSVMLRQVALGLGGELVDFAVEVEDLIVATLAELKPDRRLYANVEYYAGVVMSRCGLAPELFSPSFAVSRVVGWTANIAEQARDRRIIRPMARYVGIPAPKPVSAVDDVAA
ncbi:MAG: citrate synthase/methylcitrate synthase [Actinomycetota bacterium]|nr:citrate synthase/methylcitrate synthase [Actinomycetota bacterium]